MANGEIRASTCAKVRTKITPIANAWLAIALKTRLLSCFVTTKSLAKIRPRVLAKARGI